MNTQHWLRDYSVDNLTTTVQYHSTANTVQSDLAYLVLFYPVPSPSGGKSLVTDLQHNMACIHIVCAFDYPVPSPIRIYFCGKRMFEVKRGLTVVQYCSMKSGHVTQVCTLHHFTARRVPEWFATVHYWVQC